MVPEGSLPLKLKITSKGLSWVDLMCQKFEAICEGVDKSPPALVQETTRFIDQISTVGANVQKLCSDFMDDILPPITEINDKCLCSKFSVEFEEDLNLNEKSDQGEDTVEFSFCGEVDKSSSVLVQEATKSIADQMIMAGENVQKFSSDSVEDMLALVKNIDDKCLSSKLSASAEEDLKRSDLEKAMDKTLNCESVDFPDVYQEEGAAIEIQMLDVIDQLNDKCLCSKFSVEFEEDLNLNEKPDQGEDTVEFSFCEEVDKSSSALVQEATKPIADQMIMAGENVQKFSSDLVEDMLALVKNIDDKCLSSKLSASAEEDLERSDPEKAMDKTLNCESVDFPDVYQEEGAAIEIQMLDVIDQLNASCIHEENVSVKSTGEDLSQEKTIECYSGADASERIFEDEGRREERNCLQECAEPLITQINIPLELDGELLSNRAEVVGVTEQGKNGTMDLAGKIKFEDHPSPGEKLLLENGIMEVISKEYENVEQNFPNEDVGVLSVAEPYTAISPTCFKEGNFKKSLYLAVKEKEQVACWYGNPQVQAHKGIVKSPSNSFVDITDSCRWPDVESSDSEWELL